MLLIISDDGMKIMICLFVWLLYHIAFDSTEKASWRVESDGVWGRACLHLHWVECLQCWQWLLVIK